MKRLGWGHAIGLISGLAAGNFAYQAWLTADPNYHLPENYPRCKDCERRLSKAKRAGRSV